MFVRYRILNLMLTLSMPYLSQFFILFCRSWSRHTHGITLSMITMIFSKISDSLSHRKSDGKRHRHGLRQFPAYLYIACTVLIGERRALWYTDRVTFRISSRMWNKKMVTAQLTSGVCGVVWNGEASRSFRSRIKCIRERNIMVFSVMDEC